jgi:hypothetical protein
LRSNAQIRRRPKSSFMLSSTAPKAGMAKDRGEAQCPLEPRNDVESMNWKKKVEKAVSSRGCKQVTTKG